MIKGVLFKSSPIRDFFYGMGVAVGALDAHRRQVEALRRVRESEKKLQRKEYEQTSSE